MASVAVERALLGVKLVYKNVLLIAWRGGTHLGLLLR
jgi:hypothetical protein